MTTMALRVPFRDRPADFLEEARAAPDCSDANLSRPRGSRSMMKFTDQLHTLQTPSKRTTGCSPGGLGHGLGMIA